MISIWKQQLALQSKQEIQVPAGSQIMTAQEQNGVPCLWFSVNTERPLEQRTIHIIGTGHPIEDPKILDFIDTVQIGPHVWHIFEQIGEVMEL